MYFHSFAIVCTSIVIIVVLERKSEVLLPCDVDVCHRMATFNGIINDTDTTAPANPCFLHHFLRLDHHTDPSMFSLLQRDQKR